MRKNEAVLTSSSSLFIARPNPLASTSKSSLFLCPVELSPPSSSSMTSFHVGHDCPSYRNLRRKNRLMQFTSRLKKLLSARAQEREKYSSLLGIRMSRADHLREINHDRLPIPLYEDVELVEISMYQAVVGKTHNKLHELGIQLVGRVHGGYLTQRVRIDERHDEAVSGLVNWYGYRESIGVKDFHIGELALCGQAREVHP